MVAFEAAASSSSGSRTSDPVFAVSRVVASPRSSNLLEIDTKYHDNSVTSERLLQEAKPV